MPDDISFVVLEWVARVFWTCDLCLNFFTGYFERDGSIYHVHAHAYTINSENYDVHATYKTVIVGQSQ